MFKDSTALHWPFYRIKDISDTDKPAAQATTGLTCGFVRFSETSFPLQKAAAGDKITRLSTIQILPRIVYWGRGGMMQSVYIFEIFKDSD
jgi:hypothetical protein